MYSSRCSLNLPVLTLLQNLPFCIVWEYIRRRILYFLFFIHIIVRLIIVKYFIKFLISTVLLQVYLLSWDMLSVFVEIFLLL